MDFIRLTSFYACTISDREHFLPGLLIRRIPTRRMDDTCQSDHSVSETALSVVGLIHTAQHAVVKCVANDSCPAFLCLDTWQVSD